MNLYELLEYAQKRENECCYVIVKKFNGLIKKYAKKLAYEDAESDLICYFVELIYTFPLEKFKRTDEGRIVSYIVRCLKNQYILLLKKLIKTQQEINMSEMSTEQQFIIELFVAKVKYRKLQPDFVGICRINGWSKCRY